MTKETLQSVLSSHGVQLTKHEFTSLVTLYQQSELGSPVVNFLKMSQQLGLHSKQLEQI